MYNEEILTHQDSPTCSKEGLRIIPQPWTKYLEKKQQFSGEIAKKGKSSVSFLNKFFASIDKIFILEGR